MEAPQVWVYAADLGGKSPVAMRDSVEEFRLAIDFSRPAEEIAATLTELFQENIDSGLWARRSKRDEGEAGQ